MCTQLPVEAHHKAVATLAVAKDRTRGLHDRAIDCQVAMGTGIVGASGPPGVDLEPFCQVIKDVRSEARKLWDEELSPQAQRRLQDAAQDADPPR